MKKTAALAVLAAALVAAHGSARAGGKSLGDLPAFGADAATLRAAVAAAPTPAAAGTDGIALFAERRFRFDAHGVVQVTDRRIYTIGTAKMAKDWTRIELEWAPWSETQPTIRARVLDPGGRFVELDPASIVVEAAGTPHVDAGQRAESARLPGLAPGVIVEEQVRWTKKPLVPGAGVRGSYEFGFAHLFAVRERLVIDSPRGMRLHVGKHAAAGLAHTVTRSGGRVVHVYERGPSAPEQLPSYAPPDASDSPRIRFSSAPSWRSVARAFARNIDGQIAAGKVDASAISLPRKGGRAALLRAALAAVRAHVQLSRLGLGASEPAPWTPAETWKQGRGTGLDRATLLLAILRHAGLRAQIALVRTGPNRDIDPALPGLSFDLPLVVVSGRHRTWIDPASDFTRVGELPANAQGRHALLLGRSTRRPVDTPKSSATDNHIQETRQIFLAEHGPARVVETTVVSGQQELDYRDYYGGTKASDVRKNLSSYVSRQFEAHMDRYVPAKATDLSKPFTLRIEASSSDGFAVPDDGVTVSMRAGSMLLDLPEPFTKDDWESRVAQRKVDFDANYPYSHALTYEIHIPESFVVEQLPSGDETDLGVLHLRRRISARPGLVTAEYDLTLPRARITADELRATRKAVRRFLPNKALSFYLEPLASHAIDAKQVADAIRQLKRLAAAAPEKAGRHRQLAYLLLEMGLRDQAVIEAREAVKLRRDASTLHILGWVLSHGKLGRIRGRGADRAGAIRAYRQALELEPKRLQTLINLAVLLEYDCYGLRYQHDVSESVELYRRYFAAGGTNTSYRHNQATVLVIAGRWAEARKIAAAQPASAWRNAVLVAVAAHDSGIDAAVAEARKLGGDVDMTLGNANAVFLFRREYAMARSLLLAASKASTSRKVVLREAAGLMGRMKANAPLAPWSDPRRPVQEAFRRSFIRRGAEAPLKSLYAGLARAVHRRPPHAELVRKLHETMVRNAVSGRVAADLFLATATMTVDENRWGARVTTTSSLLPSSPLKSYLVRDGKRWRLLEWSQRPETLAAQALRLRDKGDEAGARTWIDWALDAASSNKKSDVYMALDLLWTHSPHDLLHIERAAAAVLAHTEMAREMVGILDACIQSKDQFRSICVAELLEAGDALKDLAIVRRAAAPLLAQKPDPALVRAVARGIAEMGGPWAEVERLARAVLANTPDDHDATYLLALARAGAGDGVGATQLLRKLADAPGNDTMDLNEFAWQALIIGDHGDDVLLAAKRAVALDRRHADLNTLAAVQASRDELDDAYATVMDSIKENHGVPDPSDLLVMGRIAQGLGYQEAARAAYTRVPATHSGHGDYALAQHWLDELAAAPGAAP